MEIINEDEQSSKNSTEADQTRPDNPLQKSRAEKEKVL